MMGEKIFIMIVALLSAGIGVLLWRFMVTDKEKPLELPRSRNYEVALIIVAALTIFAVLAAVLSVAELVIGSLI